VGCERLLGLRHWEKIWFKIAAGENLSIGMTPVSGAKPAEAKVMVSNLPLLFARGSPTSLESMCLEELQGFLRFVLKCELNLPSVDVSSLPQPAWWPSQVEWGEALLQRREQRGKTSTTLRGAIRACYTYHECLYLLEFCRKLISYTGGIQNLQVVDNRDGTRSLLNRANKKLLVTFRAENQDYDKTPPALPSTSSSPRQGPRSLMPMSPRKHADSSRLRQLLSTSTSDNTSDPSLTKCVDVYLCDNCDKDFDSLQDLITHEKGCGKKEVVCLEAGVTPQEAFLASNFKLCSRGGNPPSARKLKEGQRPKASSYDKFMDIELSSPLGRYIVTSSKLGLDVQNPASRGFKSVEEYVREVEQRCPGTSRAFKSCNAAFDVKQKWMSTFRGSRKKSSLWVHLYCFTAAQMEKRVRELRCGLTAEAMRLLRKCTKKKAKLKLKRLTDSDEGRNLVETVKQRYEEEHRQFLEEEKKKEEAERARKKPADRVNKLVSEKSCTAHGDEAIIDELLQDDSSDTISIEEEVLESSPKKKIKLGENKKSVEMGSKKDDSNSFVQFENVGFRTNGSFVVKDEIVSPSTNPLRPSFSVPPSLSSLQKKAKPKEVVCVDLCSSDED